MIYWDTACVVKLYAPEPDSAAYLNLAAASTGPLVSSALLTVEFSGAVLQKEMRGELRPGSSARLGDALAGDVALGRWLLAPVGTDVLDQARMVARRCLGQPRPLTLRTLDSIHLATALLLKADQFLSTDKRLRQAAALFGLSLHNPGDQTP